MTKNGERKEVMTEDRQEEEEAWERTEEVRKLLDKGAIPRRKAERLIRMFNDHGHVRVSFLPNWLWYKASLVEISVKLPTPPDVEGAVSRETAVPNGAVRIHVIRPDEGMADKWSSMVWVRAYLQALKERHVRDPIIGSQYRLDNEGTPVVPAKPSGTTAGVMVFVHTSWLVWGGNADVDCLVVPDDYPPAAAITEPRGECWRGDRELHVRFDKPPVIFQDLRKALKDAMNPRPYRPPPGDVT
jgi:hypothetical protein